MSIDQNVRFIRKSSDKTIHTLSFLFSTINLWSFKLSASRSGVFLKRSFRLSTSLHKYFCSSRLSFNCSWSFVTSSVAISEPSWEDKYKNKINLCYSRNAELFPKILKNQLTWDKEGTVTPSSDNFLLASFRSISLRLLTALCAASLSSKRSICLFLSQSSLLTSSWGTKHL